MHSMYTFVMFTTFTVLQQSQSLQHLDDALSQCVRTFLFWSGQHSGNTDLLRLFVTVSLLAHSTRALVRAAVPIELTLAARAEDAAFLVLVRLALLVHTFAPRE